MRTIRGRLLAMLLPGLALVLLVGGAAEYWIARAALTRQLDAAIAARANTLASSATYDDGRLEFELDEWDDEMVAGWYYELRTPTGEVIRRSTNLTGGSLMISAGRQSGLAFENVQLPEGRRGRASSLAFQPRVEEAPRGADPMAMSELIVTTAIDREPIDRALSTLLAVLVIVGGVIGVISGALIAAGVGWGLAPLERLSRQLGGVEGATIPRRIDDADTPGELIPVYRELNCMLDRVEQTLERERSFARAAAHELRTPLAELRTTAEVAVRWPENGRAVGSLRDVLSIAREMEHLVESLLLISRGNGHQLDGGIVDAPVAPLINRVLDRFRKPAEDKRLRIIANVDDAQALPDVPAALEIILRNLIDNAVRYTPHGGSIIIRTERTEDGAACIVVENGPVELAEGDLPRLFEPFWRGDGARSDREHVGLGLSVVERLSEASGLRVAAAMFGERLRVRVFSSAAIAARKGSLGGPPVPV